ncbi:hypothetical protein LX32DRAFT_121208 [Colletotrichum zoysiae]|uniref:Uncharacterized protein n=1 Tax=Colletotrichum zoysiae TaxID=1216348 RepID=A0AAD9LVS0_9PEZI|nr:hypothetical protein LX32DRAFT_121208 [Colletotrichum zoysiae]
MDQSLRARTQVGEQSKRRRARGRNERERERERVCVCVCVCPTGAVRPADVGICVLPIPSFMCGCKQASLQVWMDIRMDTHARYVCMYVLYVCMCVCYGIIAVPSYGTGEWASSMRGFRAGAIYPISL